MLTDESLYMLHSRYSITRAWICDFTSSQNVPNSRGLTGCILVVGGSICKSSQTPWSVIIAVPLTAAALSSSSGILTPRHTEHKHTHTHGGAHPPTHSPQHWLLFPKAGVQPTSSVTHLLVTWLGCSFWKSRPIHPGWRLVIFLGSPEQESLLEILNNR